MGKVNQILWSNPMYRFESEFVGEFDKESANRVLDAIGKTLNKMKEDGLAKDSDIFAALEKLFFDKNAESLLKHLRYEGVAADQNKQVELMNDGFSKAFRNAILNRAVEGVEKTQDPK